LDQPANEVGKLEAVLRAFDRWEEKESKATKARTRNRQRHEPTVITENIE
jgi:hypothetical protein